jgi:UTP--glucose-1-phosphate uridylyltransferase
MGRPFDRDVFERERARYLAEGLAGNRFRGEARVPVRPPVNLQGLGADRREQLRARGQRALDQGRVALLVMAGGMATRFGGAAKAVVPVLAGHPGSTFLAVKIADAVRRTPGVAVVVMHSSATRDPVLNQLEADGWFGVRPGCRYEFGQTAMPRMLEDGTPLYEVPGVPPELAFAPAGHGDAVTELGRGGVLARLLDAGVDTLLVSNVDNLGATLDPVALGCHLEAGPKAGPTVTAEVVRRRPGDLGASVVERADGRQVIVEDFRLPPGESDRFPHFSINTLWMAAPALATPPDLDWFFTRKTVVWPDSSARVVIQLERLVGQLAELVRCAYLEVPDDRFVPIKTPADLERHGHALRGAVHRAGLGGAGA